MGSIAVAIAQYDEEHALARRRPGKIYAGCEVGGRLSVVPFAQHHLLGEGPPASGSGPDLKRLP